MMHAQGVVKKIIKNEVTRMLTKPRVYYADGDCNRSGKIDLAKLERSFLLSLEKSRPATPSTSTITIGKFLSLATIYEYYCSVNKWMILHGFFFVH